VKIVFLITEQKCSDFCIFSLKCQISQKAFLAEFFTFTKSM
jgi:hypothetical protein